MTVRLATPTRNAMVAARGALWDGGTIEIRTGAQPATPETAASGTLLATFTIPATAFGAPATGVATFDADPDLEATGAADGTAGWARVKDDGGATVEDGSVGTSGTDFIINTTAITTGLPLLLTAGTLTQPAS